MFKKTLQIVIAIPFLIVIFIMILVEKTACWLFSETDDERNLADYGHK